MPTETQVSPIYGGELALFRALQTNADPAVGIKPLYTGGVVNNFGSVGYVNQPAITSVAVLDEIRPLGTFQRKQANVMDSNGTISFDSYLQDASALATGIRSVGGLLSYYTFLWGNAAAARLVIGAKCDSMDITINRGQPVKVTDNYQHLISDIYTTNPGNMAYISDTIRPFYGFEMSFSFSNTSLVSYLIKSIHINVSHSLERLPPKLFYDTNAATPVQTTKLVSTAIKEKQQIVKVSFELYDPLTGTVGHIADVCKNIVACTATLTDPCSATRNMVITIPGLVFSTDNISGGAGQEIQMFTAEASAQDITVAYTA